MSRHELVDAYLSGTINRRAFVRGLTALGVSVNVAAAYAVALQSATAARDDFYPSPRRVEQCRDGGHAKFGFKNRERCLKYVRRRD